SGISQMKDLLAGFDVLRSFGRADRFIQKGSAASDEMEAAGCKMEAAQNYVTCGVGFVSVCLQMLQQVCTVVLAVNGRILIGAIVSASNLTAGIANGMSTIASKRISMASAKPYFEHISVHSVDVREKTDARLPAIKTAITVDDLSFRYGDKPVLENRSFRFEKGGKYALTGPSGCGKSTILKLILGWLPDYSGKICFDGVDAKAFTVDQLQSQISYIEQNVFLFNTTIRDNITLGRHYSDECIEWAVTSSALDGDLSAMPLGLDTPVGENGSNLSGGQKQRVAIARALIHSRSVLLVDEGTSALDQKNADIVEKSLLENPDLTLILVSHHLSPERKAQFDKVFEFEPIVNAATA
ncbi:MAG: ABC transporter ATP-binding protein, partial [Oscillospiraceae bacterium]|nr:ABC transporter ATP-binding protein [Oscillospiraceae bacterium]